MLVYNPEEQLAESLSRSRADVYNPEKGHGSSPSGRVLQLDILARSYRPESGGKAEDVSDSKSVGDDTQRSSGSRETPRDGGGLQKGADLPSFDPPRSHSTARDADEQNRTEQDDDSESSNAAIEKQLFQRRLSKEEKSIIDTMQLERASAYEQMENCTPFEAAQYAEHTRLGKYDIDKVPERIRKLCVTGQRAPGSASAHTVTDVALSPQEVERIMAGAAAKSPYRMKPDETQAAINREFFNKQNLIKPSDDVDQELANLSYSVELSGADQAWLSGTTSGGPRSASSSSSTESQLIHATNTPLYFGDGKDLYRHDFVEIFIPEHHRHGPVRMHRGIPGNWRAGQVGRIGVWEATRSPCAEIIVRPKASEGVHGQVRIFTLTLTELPVFVRRLDLADMEKFAVERPDSTWQRREDLRRLETVKDKLVEVLLGANTKESVGRLGFMDQKEVHRVKKRQMREECRTKYDPKDSSSPALDALSPVGNDQQRRFRVTDRILTNKKRLEAAEQVPNLVGELRSTIRSPGGTYREEEELCLLNPDGTLDTDVNLSNLDWSFLLPEELDAVAKIFDHYIADDLPPRPNLHSGQSPRRFGDDSWRGWEIPPRILDRPVHRNSLRTQSEPPTPDDGDPFAQIYSAYQSEFLDVEGRYERACFDDADCLKTTTLQKQKVEHVRSEMQAAIDRTEKARELRRKRAADRDVKEKAARNALPPTIVGKAARDLEEKNRKRQKLVALGEYEGEEKLQELMDAICADRKAREMREMRENVALLEAEKKKTSIRNLLAQSNKRLIGRGQGGGKKVSDLRPAEPTATNLSELTKKVPHPIVVETSAMNLLRILNVREIADLKRQRRVEFPSTESEEEIFAEDDDLNQSQESRVERAEAAAYAKERKRQLLLEEDRRKTSKLSTSITLQQAGANHLTGSKTISGSRSLQGSKSMSGMRASFQGRAAFDGIELAGRNSNLWAADPEYRDGKRDSELGVSLMFDKNRTVPLPRSKSDVLRNREVENPVYKSIVRPAGAWFKDQQKTASGKKTSFRV